MSIIRNDQLPFSEIAHEFIGDDHGGVGITFLLVDTPPGRGPRLHKHPYEEVIIVQEGQGSYVLGDEETEVRAGEIVVIPADTPHRFVSTGSERLRAIDIHVSPRFSTEWLEESG